MSPLDVKALKSLFGDGSLSAARLVATLDATRASAEDCETPEARAIWMLAEKSVRDGIEISPEALAERLPAQAAEIEAIADEMVTGMGTQILTVFHDKGVRRRYLDSLRTIARIIQDPASSSSAAVAEAQKLLTSWQDETSAIQMMDSSVFALVDEVEAVQCGKVPPVLQSGIEAWDAVMGGLQPTLTMVGAPPGVGKSSLVAGMLRMIALRGVKVGLISLEDERGWLTRRLVSHYCQIPVFVLANQRLYQAQKDRLDQHASEAFDVLANVACDDRSGLTVDDVVASARRMISMGCKAIFVDHLGEISIARTNRHDLDIADVLRELRVIAKVARVPVIVLAHMKRSDRKDGEPLLSDFAFSAGVERMARVAVGLWRDGDALMCSVLKQTQGKSGVAFELNVNKSAAIVVETAASAAARSLYNGE